MTRTPITHADLTAAGTELARQAASVQAMIRDALRAGGGTAELRASLLRIEEAARKNADRLAAMRAEDEAEQRARTAGAVSALARASSEKLKLRLAELAPPRIPRIARGRG